jgi:hypothetical protein
LVKKILLILILPKILERIYILTSLLKFERRNKIKHEFIVMLNLINNSHIK